jgi:hypothetical protein
VSPVKYELGFYIPEDAILHSDRREDLNSHVSGLRHDSDDCETPGLAVGTLPLCAGQWARGMGPRASCNWPEFAFRSHNAHSTLTRAQSNSGTIRFTSAKLIRPRLRLRSRDKARVGSESRECPVRRAPIVLASAEEPTTHRHTEPGHQNGEFVP